MEGQKLPKEIIMKVLIVLYIPCVGIWMSVREPQSGHCVDTSPGVGMIRPNISSTKFSSFFRLMTEDSYNLCGKDNFLPSNVGRENDFKISGQNGFRCGR